MADYNTFMVYDCKKRKTILITSSARKAKNMLHTGFKIEVWNSNNLIETIYTKQITNFDRYISLEKEYIAHKQFKAKSRNDKRRKKHGL